MNRHRSLDALDILHRLSIAIVQATDLKQIYELILDQVVDMLSVEKASIMVYDAELQALRIAAARGMPPELMQQAVVRIGEGISGRVFRTHEPLLVDDIQAEGIGERRERYRTNSLMSAPVTCFPMKVGEKTLGVINVTDRAHGKPFTPDDLKLLMTISNQAAAYLHICQLSESLSAGERIRQQMEIARDIQYRLLPLLPPAIEGIESAGRLLTAERVGGDYYDVLFSRTNHPSFIVADVSGHSLGAALMMAGLRAAVRAQLDSDSAPAILVGKVNDMLYEDLLAAEQFISLVYLQYVRSRRMLLVTTAGHPPGFIWRATNKKIEELTTDDPLLGIERHVAFHEHKVAVTSGDVVVLYTDGLTEATNSSGERFGSERFRQAIALSAGKTAEEMVEAIVGEVRSFVHERSLRDDITLLVLNIL